MAKQNVNLGLEPALMAVLRNAAKPDQTKKIDALKLKVDQQAREIRSYKAMAKRVRADEDLAHDKAALEKAAKVLAAEAQTVINRIKALKQRKLASLMNPKAWYEVANLASARAKLLRAAKNV